MNVKSVAVYYDEDDNKEYKLKEETQTITLQNDEVSIQVNSCGISTVNEKIFRRLHTPGEKGGYPFGREISGVVQSVGENVIDYKENDEVVGIIPLDSHFSGCANACVMSQYDIVHKSTGVSHLDAACGIGDAVKAYTALFYQAKLTCNKTVVVTSASKGFGIIAIQLAMHIGAKVIAVARADEEVDFLKSMKPLPDRVVDMRSKDIVSVCLEESMGLGVDCFIDNGVECYPSELKSLGSNLQEDMLPTKRDILSTLAVGASWVTIQHDLQLNSSDSELMFLKRVSLHYLFEDSWTLSCDSQGRYLRIFSYDVSKFKDMLKDIMEKMKEGIIRPAVHHTVLLDDCVENIPSMLRINVGKAVVRM